MINPDQLLDTHEGIRLINEDEGGYRHCRRLLGWALLLALGSLFAAGFIHTI